MSVQRPNACEKRLITFSQSYPCHVVLVEKETAVLKARSARRIVQAILYAFAGATEKPDEFNV